VHHRDPTEDAVERAALALSSHIPDDAPPQVLLTLGSGLSGVADRIEDPIDVPLRALPGLEVSTVPGHSGRLRYGWLGGQPVLAQMGRIHLYEGHDPSAVTRVVDVAAELGCDTFVVTNAAGGIDQTFTPGDLMVIDDHLNLTGGSPLTGRLVDDAPVFLDMAGAYDPALRELLDAAAAAVGTELRHGVYAGLRGPQYETPAEIAMLRTLGAHAVGMSTVLEVIAARAAGLRVAGVSSITNVHGEGVATSHEEVVEVGARAAETLGRVLLELLDRLGS
jgi:purine-nucleoside phosphorylase